MSTAVLSDSLVWCFLTRIKRNPTFAWKCDFWRIKSGSVVRCALVYMVCSHLFTGLCQTKQLWKCLKSDALKVKLDMHLLFSNFSFIQ